MRCIGTLEFIDEFQQNCQRTQRNFVAAKKLQKCPRIKVASPTSGGSRLDDAESDKENASPIVTPSRKRKRPASTIEESKILKIPLGLSTNGSLTMSINESDRTLAEKSLGKSDHKRTPLATHNPASTPSTKGLNVSHKPACSPSTKSTCESDTKSELPEVKIPGDGLLRSPDNDPSTPRTRARASARAVPKGSPKTVKTTGDSPSRKSVVKLEKTESHENSNEPESVPIERVKLPEAERPKSSRAEKHHDECPIAGDEAGKRLEKSPESSASRATTIGEKSVNSTSTVGETSAARSTAGGHVTPRSKRSLASAQKSATSIGGEKSATSIGGGKSATSIGGEKSATSIGGEKSATSIGGEKSATAIGSEKSATSIGSEKSATSIGSKKSATSIGSEKSATSIGSEKSATSIGSEKSATSIGSEKSATSIGSEKSATSIGSEKSATSIGSEKSATSIGGEKSATPIGSEKSATSIGSEKSATPTAVQKSATPSPALRSAVKSSASAPARRRRERRSAARNYEEEDEDDDDDDEAEEDSRRKFGKISDLITSEQKEAIEKFYTLDMSVVDEEVVGEKIVFLERRTYGCKICAASYPRQDKCQVHIWGHLGMRPYRCNACDFATVTVSNIRCHIRKSHLKIKPYACELCEKRYVTAFLLEEHMNTHTGSRPYGCNLCKFTSASRQVLSYHKSTHKTVKDITCHVCGKEFYSKGRMRAHMVIHNKDKAANMCKLCSIYLCNSEALERHHANVHSQDYVCNVCGKRCKSKKALGNHQNVHSAAKYKCTLCSNVYKSSHILKEHLLKHKGIRQYKCNVCGKDFAQQSHLAAHMAVHSEKRFPCPGCSRPFNRHDNMKMHTKRCEAFLANPELGSLLTIRRGRSKPADESRLGADLEKSAEIEPVGEITSDSPNLDAPNPQGQIKLLAVGGPNDEPVQIEDLTVIIGNTIVIPCT